MESAKVQRLIEEKVFFPYQSMLPEIDDSVFIASGVKIIGNVRIGKNSSVWYNTVLRGDVNFIRIGELTNVQDCSMLHVTSETYPLIIGDKVTIGHSVTLHGCTVNNLCLIGMGAVVLDGAVVSEGSVVAAGAVVLQNLWFLRECWLPEFRVKLFDLYRKKKLKNLKNLLFTIRIMRKHQVIH